MSIFKDYSKYYDLLYKDKDYTAEALYLHGLIESLRPGSSSLLDLGCGTGGHAFAFAKLGYLVSGVDFSEGSIKAAEAKRASGTRTDRSVGFFCGDIREIRLQRRFDVVVSLFHVMSYLTGEADLQAGFATAKAHLGHAGVFLFDFWHGPGVLSDPPKITVKRLEDQGAKIIRIAEPTMHPGRNTVEVNYTLIVQENQCFREIRETHPMRYLFRPELETYLARAGFTPVLFHKWMTREEPRLASWFTIMGARSQD